MPPTSLSTSRVPPLPAVMRIVAGGGLLLQLARGWMIYLAIAWAGRIGAVADSMLTSMLLTAAALACGAGFGSACDRWLRTRSNAAIALLLLPVVSIAAAAALPWISAMAWTLIAAFAIGSGLGHPWNGDAQILRTVVSVRQRWKILSFYEVCLPLGFLAGAIGGPNDLAVFAPVLSGTIAVAALLLFGPDRLSAGASSSVPEDSAGDSSSDPTANLKPQFTDPQHGTNGVADDLRSEVNPKPDDPADAGQIEATQDLNADDSCGEEDCCGGTRKAFQSPPLSGGVALMAVATSTALSLAVPLIVLLSGSSLWQGIAAAAAVAVGFGLLHATAPRTGYVLAVLPFLLMLVLASLFVITTGPGPLQIGYLLSAVCAGAIWAALQSQPGELYTDCPPTYFRSQVVTSGFFVAAILMLPIALAARHWSAVGVVGGSSLFFAVAAFAALRTIPTPVLSSLGKEDEASSDDEEYQDVLTALQSQN